MLSRCPAVSCTCILVPAMLLDTVEFTSSLQSLRPTCWRSQSSLLQTLANTVEFESTASSITLRAKTDLLLESVTTISYGALHVSANDLSVTKSDTTDALYVTAATGDVSVAENLNVADNAVVSGTFTATGTVIFSASSATPLSPDTCTSGEVRFTSSASRRHGRWLR